jgi:hypothetical protein
LTSSLLHFFTSWLLDFSTSAHRILFQPFFINLVHSRMESSYWWWNRNETDLPSHSWFEWRKNLDRSIHQSFNHLINDIKISRYQDIKISNDKIQHLTNMPRERDFSLHVDCIMYWYVLPCPAMIAGTLAKSGMSQNELIHQFPSSS